VSRSTWVSQCRLHKPTPDATVYPGTHRSGRRTTAKCGKAMEHRQNPVGSSSTLPLRRSELKKLPSRGVPRMRATLLKTDCHTTKRSRVAFNVRRQRFHQISHTDSRPPGVEAISCSPSLHRELQRSNGVSCCLRASVVLVGTDPCVVNVIRLQTSKIGTFRPSETMTLGSPRLEVAATTAPAVGTRPEEFSLEFAYVIAHTPYVRRGPYDPFGVRSNKLK
jgi:hypothetical protein